MDTQLWQLSVCLLVVCVSALITCAINMSHNIAANWADLTADLQFEYSTGVATLSRSRDNVDVRLTESGDARSEQLLVMPTEQLTD